MGSRNGLQNKRVVVLGGSSGIGFAVAELAASQGAKAVIASSNPEGVQKAVESIGGEAQGQAVDVSQERDVATFFAKLGVFDHLVFTAGDSLHLRDLVATDLGQARRAFELRYWAALAAVKPAYSQWRFYRTHNGSGRPAPTQGMGGCLKCLRNHRGVNTRPGR